MKKEEIKKLNTEELKDLVDNMNEEDMIKFQTLISNDVEIRNIFQNLLIETTKDTKKIKQETLNCAKKNKREININATLNDSKIPDGVIKILDDIIKKRE